MKIYISPQKCKRLSAVAQIFFDNVANFSHRTICPHNAKEVKQNLTHFVAAKISIHTKEKVADSAKSKKFRELPLTNEVTKEIVECNKEENVSF